MTPVTEFVISRKKWLRGESSTHSYLLRPEDGKQCCVGIFLTACGTPAEDLLSQKVAERTMRAPEWLTDRNAFGTEMPKKDVDHLYTLNDSPKLPEDVREAEIAAIFARNGVTVSFED